MEVVPTSKLQKKFCFLAEQFSVFCHPTTLEPTPKIHPFPPKNPLPHTNIFSIFLIGGQNIDNNFDELIKNKDDVKIKDDLKHKDDLNNNDDFKNKYDFKNEDDLKKETFQTIVVYCSAWSKLKLRLRTKGEH